MATAKADLERMPVAQPDDATPEELIRELAFDLMVQNGLAESDRGDTIPNEEMQRRIASWQAQ